MTPIDCGRFAAGRVWRHLRIPAQNIVIVGGALLTTAPKDIDCIVEDLEVDVHELQMCRPVLTGLGGARFPAIDIWRLEDSDCFKRHPEWDVTLENFLRQVPEGRPRMAYRRRTDSMVTV